MEQPGPASDEYRGSALTTFIRQPAPALREYIDFYYGEEALLENFPGPYMPHQVIMMPAGGVEIHLCYHDTSFRLQISNRKGEVRGFITGERNMQTLLRVDGFKRVCKEIHVKFRPGGFYRLFDIQEGELRNTYFETGEVLGQEGRELEDRVNNCVSMAQRIEIVDKFFLRKIRVKQQERGINNTIAAVGLILKCQGKSRVWNILRELNIPKRTLERQFINHAGLTPKEFSRVVRFKGVLNRMLSVNTVDWCELAQAYGYYDQAHLIDEFKTATTFSPERFLQEKGKSVVKFRTGLFILKPTVVMPSSYAELMEETIESEEKGKGLI